MKKILEFILIAFLSVSLLSSCKGMLDEVNYGNPTAEEMFEAEENVVLLVGQAYADVKWLHDHWGYWGVASLTADECLCPVRMPGEHWSDGGYWRNLNTHTWTPLASAFKNIWDTTISGAVLCNKLLATLNDNKASMSEKVYNQYVGELEVLRSYYYYMLFDCFGRIPYLEEFVTTDAPLMEAPMVWSKLVACLEKNAPNLPVIASEADRQTNYGRVTQGFAYTLLARLYLNAESFGCKTSNIEADAIVNAGSEAEKPAIKINAAKDFYTNAVRCCDMVIDSKAYSIEPDFFTNFKIDNSTSKENIFVIVENGNGEFDQRSIGSMSNKLRLTILTLHYSQQTTYNMQEKPWNGFCARPAFMERYNKRDVRGAGDEGKGTLNEHQWGWFVGPIYSADGTTQLKDENGTPANIRPEVESLTAATWNDGARLFKYEIDRTKAYQYCENDFVLFRYADVLWMKEEAILRGGTGISGWTTDPDFATLRARTFAYENNPQAAYAAAYPDALTLPGILDERGREFAWENIRRRDLIRFGKFGDPSYVQYVAATENYRNWFPIPEKVIETSPKDENGNSLWTQNQGYN